MVLHQVGRWSLCFKWLSLGSVLINIFIIKPQTPLLQSSQSQSPQLLLTTFPPAFSSVSSRHIERLSFLLKLWGPELPTVLKVRLHWVQRDNHLFFPADHAVCDVPCEAFCPLGCEGPLLTRVEPAGLLSNHSSLNLY